MCIRDSTTSLETLRGENDLPVVGVVEPTCRRALAVSRTRKVGVIATLASIRSGVDVYKRQDHAVEIAEEAGAVFLQVVLLAVAALIEVEEHCATLSLIHISTGSSSAS